MAFRYRVVIFLYVLALLPALLGKDADGVFTLWLVIGSALSFAWLLVCWVATGTHRGAAL